MKRNLSKLFVFCVVPAVLLWTTGCSFDPAVTASNYCETDEDCLSGRLCIEGACQDSTDVITDAGAADQAASTDAGADVVVVPDTGNNVCGVDNDGDGFYTGPDCAPVARDCDDTDPAVYPGASVRCNGQDNDCDGTVDTAGCECTDGLTGDCGTDEGVCERGTRTCSGGIWGECSGGVEPVDEACNGLDDDCDGTVDEGCPCTDGDTQSCGTDQGQCSAGTQTCVAGTWSECEGATPPTDEVCNGLDDDCDGTPDNDPNDAGAPCSADSPGICSAGSLVCQSAMLVCESIQSGRPETCNGRDDDCDGATDEGVTQQCNSTCGPGVQTCNAGAFGECLPNNPPEEICNGMDDDCDGMVDESFPEMGSACDTGESGVCANGESACEQGDTVCKVVNAPATETCDGLDNDCDGLVDEDADGRVLAEACGGACPTSAVRFCFDGAWSSCDRREAELCDGADTNCDGQTDNIATCYQRCDTSGSFVAGTLDCSTGDCTLPDEICGDGIDNDCDGSVDTGCNDDLDDMVYIPGGTFLMGSRPNSPYAASDEQPLHVVELAPYYIDRYEVTREEYGQCVLSGQCSILRVGCPLQLTQQQDPITCVTWDQADDYCAWAGKRLPTEAEWEKAARGPFAREVLWPWGDSEDSSRAAMACNGTINSCAQDVTSFDNGVSYYGLHHTAGNAAEWVEDYYASNFYSAAYTVQPLQSMPLGAGHVVRGGSWSQALEFGRVANRAVDEFVPDEEIGFRCAK